MGVESYMHRFAKATFAEWLRQLARETGSDEYTKPFPARNGQDPIGWRVNRGGPHFGVWEEYPVAENYGITPVWDEWWTEEGEEEAAWMKEGRTPTREECRSIGYEPEFIFDIAVQHKGSIVYAIEIVHKNDVSERKLRKMQDIIDIQGWVKVYVVPAKWVLSQIGRPDDFVGERII
jgi:hypothetical protein